MLIIDSRKKKEVLLWEVSKLKKMRKSIALISTSILVRLIFSFIGSCSQVECLQFHGFFFFPLSFYICVFCLFFLLPGNPFDVAKKYIYILKSDLQKKVFKKELFFLNESTFNGVHVWWIQTSHIPTT